jgi:hypothetical protein
MNDDSEDRTQLDRLDAARGRSAMRIASGVALVFVGLLASGLAAPFLVPILQLALVVAAVPGLVCGALAGHWRSRLGAFAVTTALCAAYVGCNLAGSSGFLTMYEMYVLGRASASVYYFDTWFHLFHVIVIPLNLLVAMIMCEAVMMRRRRAPVGPPTCAACGYNLTGNVSGRCPECGYATDAGGGRSSAVDGSDG